MGGFASVGLRCGGHIFGGIALLLLTHGGQCAQDSVIGSVCLLVAVCSVWFTGAKMGGACLLTSEMEKWRAISSPVVRYLKIS